MENKKIPMMDSMSKSKTTLDLYADNRAVAKKPMHPILTANFSRLSDTLE